jgi:hypothetical protein
MIAAPVQWKADRERGVPERESSRPGSGLLLLMKERDVRWDMDDQRRDFRMKEFVREKLGPGSIA